MTRSTFLKFTREAALSLTAIVGALAVVVMLLSFAFGVHPLLFKSGSMEPAISTGDLSLARTVKAADLRIGDIVSVREPHQDRVTHRVVDIQGAGTIRQVTLKGDANKVIDPAVYNVKDAERVMFTVPKAGYVVAWFSHAPGSFVLAAYVALMLLLIARRNPTSKGGSRALVDEIPGPVAAEELVTVRDSPEALPPYVPVPVWAIKGRRKKTRRGPGRVKALAAGAVLALLIASVVGWTQTTNAAWVDPAGVSGVSFTAAASFDTTAPVITPVRPLNGQAETRWTLLGCDPSSGTGNGNTDVICATATDAGTGVSFVRYQLVRSTDSACWNGSNWVTPPCVANNMSLTAGNAASGTWTSGTLKNSDIVDATYTLTLTAADVNSNAAAPVVVTFYRDSTVPTGAISYPTAAAPTVYAITGCSTAGVWDMCGTAADTGSGVDRVEFELRRTSSAPPVCLVATGSATPTFTAAACAADLPATYAGGNWNINTGDLPAGTYQLQVVVYDEAGNVSATITRSGITG